MVQYNKYGLRRHIPNAKKRTVRQKCGFGCVVCGSALYQYHHVDPFVSVTEHDPSRIILLCLECHGRVTSGLLSRQTVEKSALSPKCLEKGFSSFPLDMNSNGDSASDIRVIMGTTTFINVTSFININNQSMFLISPAEVSGAPARLSALFYDTSGFQIARIDKNEWQSASGNWDVEIVGRRIIVRQKIGELCLMLRSEPPDTLVVEKLNMTYQGFRVTADAQRVSIWWPGEDQRLPGFSFCGNNPKGGTCEFSRGAKATAIAVSSNALTGEKGLSLVRSDG